MLYVVYLCFLNVIASLTSNGFCDDITGIPEETSYPNDLASSCASANINTGRFSYDPVPEQSRSRLNGTTEQSSGRGDRNRSSCNSTNGGTKQI